MSEGSIYLGDISAMRAALTHTDVDWALANPHRAMQVHIECRVGTCVAKSVAYFQLEKLGRLVPDSTRKR
ncbi:hypothetical protein ACWDOP_14010 [Nocardia sp. NPDC003693]